MASQPLKGGLVGGGGGGLGGGGLQDVGNTAHEMPQKLDVASEGALYMTMQNTHHLL